MHSGISFMGEIEKRIEETHSYKLKKVPTYDGEYFEHPESDEGIAKILEFKGNGEKRRFIDVLKEYTDREFKIVEKIIDSDYPIEESYSLYNYIVINNYQLSFDKDDIVLRCPNRAA